MCVSAYGQHTQSSYSIIGIGETNYGSLTPNQSMGGAGLAYNSRYYINTLNPALLGQNDNAVFHIGGSLDFRNYTSTEGSYQSGTGGFRDFGASLPILPGRWNVGLGFNAFSASNYAFRLEDPNGPEGTTEVVEVFGRGGLDEFYISNALTFGNFSFGAKAGLLLGTINKQSSAFLEGGTNTAFGRTVIIERGSYSDFQFQLGAAYKLKLSETNFLNFGAVWNTEANINGKLLRLLDQQGSSGNIFSRDTLSYTDTMGDLLNDDTNTDPVFIKLPQRVGFGVTYEKYQTFNLSVDYYSQDWSSYRDIFGNASPNLGKSWRLAVGGEIIPNSENPGILGLISYRFGIHSERTPYLINGQTVNDFGISFGTSLPLGAIWGLSTVNIGATIGRRGNTENGLTRENYVKLNFGFSVQDVTWFTRQKFN